MNFHRSSIVTLVLALGCSNRDGEVTSTMTTSETATTSDDSSTQVSTQDSETSPTTGAVPLCGNGLLEAGEECDDGAENDDSATCKSDCTANVCGDGVLLPSAEVCDDGNIQPGDGCDATCQVEVIPLCPPGTINILVNGGFEDGTLPPWKSDGTATAITGNPHSAMWSARVDGNAYLQQDLASATPVIDIMNATFWSWHDTSDEPVMLVEWVYDDLMVDSLLLEGVLDGWQMHDIIDKFDPAKSLLGFRVWGYFSDAPGPDVAVFDDFSFCVTR